MHKKVYDKNKGIFIYVDPWTGEEMNQIHGSGIFDTLVSLGQKVFSSSAANIGKKALETVGKQALESGTKRIGTEVGNLAADKMIGTLKKKAESKQNIKPVGELITKELKKLNSNSPSDVNIRINKLLSGSGRSTKYNFKLI